MKLRVQLGHHRLLFPELHGRQHRIRHAEYRFHRGRIAHRERRSSRRHQHAEFYVARQDLSVERRAHLAIVERLLRLRHGRLRRCHLSLARVELRLGRIVIRLRHRAALVQRLCARPSLLCIRGARVRLRELSLILVDGLLIIGLPHRCKHRALLHHVALCRLRTRPSTPLRCRMLVT